MQCILIIYENICKECHSTHIATKSLEVSYHFTAHCIIIALVIYVCAAELFHVENFKGVTENVRIMGYLPPPTMFGQTKWYLMVHEDTSGILERFPEFRPTNEHVRSAVAT